MNRMQTLMWQPQGEQTQHGQQQPVDRLSQCGAGFVVQLVGVACPGVGCVLGQTKTTVSVLEATLLLANTQGATTLQILSTDLDIAVRIVGCGRATLGGTQAAGSGVALGILCGKKALSALLAVCAKVLKLTSAPVHCMHWKSLRPWLLHSSPLHLRHCLSCALHLARPAWDSSSRQPRSLTITTKQIQGLTYHLEHLKLYLQPSKTDTHTSSRSLHATVAFCRVVRWQLMPAQL